jgi:hypothetical protein
MRNQPEPGREQDWKPSRRSSCLMHPFPGERTTERETQDEQSERPRKVPSRIADRATGPTNMPISAGLRPIDGSSSRCQRTRRSRRCLTASSRRSGWSGVIARSLQPAPRCERLVSAGPDSVSAGGRFGVLPRDRDAGRRCAQPVPPRVDGASAPTLQFQAGGGRQQALPPG